MSVFGGLFTTLGAVAESRAASAQADLAERVSAINQGFLEDDAQLARDRNERFSRAIEARVRTAAAERGLVGTSGSAEDIARANAITSEMNRSIIDENLRRGSLRLGLGLSAELVEARQRRRAAIIQGVQGLASTAESAARITLGGFS